MPVNPAAGHRDLPAGGGNVGIAAHWRERRSVLAKSGFALVVDFHETREAAPGAFATG